MKLRAMNKTTRRNTMTYSLVILSYLILQLLGSNVLRSGGVLSYSLQGQLVPICAYVVMALSLNLTVGVLGELSLGHAGFMSVGAFTGVVAAVSLEGLVSSGPVRLALAMVLGAALAGVAGLLVGIPVLRLQGDYLAIVTLAFGEIIKSIINNLYVGLDSRGLRMNLLAGAAELELEGGVRPILDGPMGASGIPSLSSFTAGIILVLVTLFIILNLVNSRAGRAIMALRDNRIAAESVGLNVTKYKLMAFTTSASLAGAAGALFALGMPVLTPNKFDFNTSILVLVFVVLGGLGNMWGSIIAAALLTVLPEVLRQFSDQRMLVYAIVLILVMIATNNATIKNFFRQVRERLLPHPGKTRGKEGNGHA